MNRQGLGAPFFPRERPRGGLGGSQICESPHPPGPRQPPRGAEVLRAGAAILEALAGIFHTPISTATVRRVRARGLQAQAGSCRPRALTRRCGCEICGLERKTARSALNGHLAQGGLEDFSGGVTGQGRDDDNFPGDLVVGQFPPQELLDGLFFQDRAVVRSDKGHRLFASPGIGFADDLLRFRGDRR